MTMQVVSHQDQAFTMAPVHKTALEARVIDAKSWDAIALQFRDVIHEQTQCFNELRWAAKNLERVAFYREGKLVSAAIVLIIKFPFVGTGVAVVKWGPLWRKIGQPDNSQDLLEAIAGLKQIYAQSRGLFLSFFPRADAEISPIEQEAFSANGFYQGEMLDSPARYFVNTGLTLTDLRASLGQKWRYNLKQAERKGLTARFVEGPDGLKTFMDLYAQMCARKNFHDTSAIDTLPDLLNATEPKLRPLILLVEKDTEIVAGAVIDASGERAVYLYGATSESALPLKAGYVMHWAIADYLCNDPTNHWYDLGGADTDCNLHQFKRGFVGKQGIIIDTPSYYHFGAGIKARLFGNVLYFARQTKGRLAKLLHQLRDGRAS